MMVSWPKFQPQSPNFCIRDLNPSLNAKIVTVLAKRQSMIVHQSKLRSLVLLRLLALLLSYPYVYYRVPQTIWRFCDFYDLNRLKQTTRTCWVPTTETSPAWWPSWQKSWSEMWFLRTILFTPESVPSLPDCINHGSISRYAFISVG